MEEIPEGSESSHSQITGVPDECNGRQDEFAVPPGIFEPPRHRGTEKTRRGRVEDRMNAVQLDFILSDLRIPISDSLRPVVHKKDTLIVFNLDISIHLFIIKAVPSSP
jgi:hypothetical protein